MTNGFNVARRLVDVGVASLKEEIHISQRTLTNGQ